MVKLSVSPVFSVPLLMLTVAPLKAVLSLSSTMMSRTRFAPWSPRR